MKARKAYQHRFIDVLNINNRDYHTEQVIVLKFKYSVAISKIVRQENINLTASINILYENIPVLIKQLQEMEGGEKRG
jgi:hypothetical protein